MTAVLTAPAVTRPRAPRAPKAAKGGRLTYVLLGLCALVSVLPLYWTIVAGSHSNAEMSATPPPLVPGGSIFSNIRLALDSAPIAKAVLNSVIVSGAITVGTVLCCTLAGFAFAKLSFRGSKLLLALVIGTMMVPTQLSIIPLFILIASCTG